MGNYYYVLVGPNGGITGGTNHNPGVNTNPYSKTPSLLIPDNAIIGSFEVFSGSYINAIAIYWVIPSLGTQGTGTLFYSGAEKADSGGIQTLQPGEYIQSMTMAYDANFDNTTNRNLPFAIFNLLVTTSLQNNYRFGSDKTAYQTVTVNFPSPSVGMLAGMYGLTGDYFNSLGFLFRIYE